MDEEKIKQLHAYLSSNWDGFSASYDDFRTSMEDENNVRSLHKNLSGKIESFTASFEDFYGELKTDKKKVDGIGAVGGATAKAEEAKPLGIGDFDLPELPEEVAKASSTRISKPFTTAQDIANQSSAPMTMDQLQTILKEPIETQQDKLTYKINEGAKEWYVERGGYTPEQKIVSFNTELEEYKQSTDYTEGQLANNISGLANKWGLKLSKDEETGGVRVSVRQDELDQYNEILGREINKHLKDVAKKEKDPWQKQVWDKLEMGSERVLNSVSNFMAIGEIAGNAIVKDAYRSLGATQRAEDYSESSLYQDVANFKNEALAEERQESQGNQETDIIKLLQSGDVPGAIAATALGVVEEIPQLTTLIMGNWAGYVKPTLAFMGVSKGAEEYLELDKDPDMATATKIFNSLGKTLSEIVYEGVGTVTILNSVRKGIARSGKEVVREALYKSYQPYLERKLSVLMKGVSPMVREASSEGATEMTDNIMDIASGKDVGVFDNVENAMIIGGAIGGGISIPSIVQNKKGFVDRMIKQLPKDFSLEAKEEMISLHIQYEALQEAKKEASELEKKFYDKKIKEIDNRVDEIHKIEGYSPEGTLGAVEEGQVETKKKKKTEPLKVKPMVMAEQMAKKKEKPVAEKVEKTDEEVFGKEGGHTDVVIETTEKEGTTVSDQYFGKKKVNTEKEVKDEIELVETTKQEAKEEIIKRENVDKTKPYKIFGETFETKDEFISALESIPPDKVDAEVINSNEIKYDKDVSLTEVTEAIDKGERETSVGRVYKADIKYTSLQELKGIGRLANARVAELNKLTKETDAKEVRGDKEVLQEQGVEPVKSKDEGGKDIQLPKEEGGEASKSELPQEKVKPEKPSESLLSAKKDVFTTVEKIGEKKIPKVKKLAEMKEAMTDFIRANRKELEKVTGQKIPTMINRVNEVKTIKSFKKATDYIDRVVEDVKYREEEKTLSKAEQVFDEHLDIDSKKYSTVKEKIKKFKPALRKGVSQRLKRIKKLAYEKTSNEVAEMPEYKGVFDKLNDQGVEALTAEEYDLYEETKFAGAMTEPRTGEELTKLGKELKDYLNQVKTESRKKYEADKIILEEKIQKQAIPILTKGKALKTEHGQAERKKNLFEKIKEKTAIPTLASWHSLMDALGVKQGKTDIYDTWFNREYGEPIHEANNNFFEGRTEVLNKVIDQYKKIFGAKWKSVEMEYKEKKKIEYIDEWKTAAPPMELSQEDAGYIYGQMQDENMHPTLAGDKMRYMRKNEDGDYDLTKKGEALVGFLDPKMKEWMDWQVDFYRDYLYERYNEEYNKLYGRDMPRNDTYIPILREATNKGDSVEDMFKDMSFQSLGSNRHMMGRTGSKSALREVGSTEVLINYINRMERFRAFGEPLRKINRELMHPDVQKAIAQEFTPKYNAVIKDFVDDMSGKYTSGKYSQFFEGVRIRATQAMLGLKPGLMVKQLTSFPAYASFLPPGRLVAGMGKFAYQLAASKFNKNIKNPVDILMRSQFLKERKGKGFDRDQVDAMVKEYNSLGNAKNKFMETAMIFIKYGDMAPILFAGYSVYDYNYNKALKDGATKEEADKIGMRKFELATKFTQQSSLTDDLSYWQRHSSISKLMTMYATAPYSYVRLVNTGVRRIVQQGDFKRGAKAILMGHVVLPVLFRAASMAFRFEEDDDEWWKDLVQAGIFGPFDSMFMLGDAISFLADQFRGKPFDYQMSPTSSLVSESANAMIKAKRTLEDVAEEGLTITDVLEMSDAIVEAASLWAGVPYVGARRTLGQWGNIAKGEVEGVPDTIRALLGFKTKSKKEEEGSSSGFKKSSGSSSGGGFKKKGSKSSGGFKK